MIVSGLFCGLYLPVPWFPGWLRAIADWSPWPAMLQHPLDILSGRVVGGEVGAVLGNQVLWAVVLLALGQVVLRAGRRHLEVQGG
jgi:ABC-2 type transport system permease protein